MVQLLVDDVGRVIDVWNPDDGGDEGVGEGDDVLTGAELERPLERSEELAVGLAVGSGPAVFAVCEDSGGTELELVSRLNNRSFVVVGAAPS